ncbi:hypothetical protein CMEL01_14381, partial [Colletotrichum melonis]
FVVGEKETSRGRGREGGIGLPFEGRREGERQHRQEQLESMECGNGKNGTGIVAVEEQQRKTALEGGRVPKVRGQNMDVRQVLHTGSARLERLRQMPSPLEFVGKARRKLGAIAHMRGVELAGAGNGAKGGKKRDTLERSGGGRAWGGASATHRGKHGKQRLWERGGLSLRASLAPVVVGAQPAMTAMAPVARLGNPSRASTSLGSIGLQTTAYLLGTLDIRTDSNGSGSLPFHTSGSLWNHNRPRFKRPSPRYTTEVVSAADIPHCQRPSLYPEFLHSSTVWGSWESWLSGHVCQPPILSGHCRPAKLASSTHPAIFFPVAQHQHGPSYLRFLTLQATYKPSSRHIRDEIKSPLS